MAVPLLCFAHTPTQVNLQMSVRVITTCMFHDFFFEVCTWAGTAAT